MLLNCHITILKKYNLTENILCNPLFFKWSQAGKQASSSYPELGNSTGRPTSGSEQTSLPDKQYILNILSLCLPGWEEAVIMPMALKEKEKNLNL